MSRRDRAYYDYDGYDDEDELKSAEIDDGGSLLGDAGSPAVRHRHRHHRRHLHPRRRSSASPPAREFERLHVSSSHVSAPDIVRHRGHGSAVRHERHEGYARRAGSRSRPHGRTRQEEVIVTEDKPEIVFDLRGRPRGYGYDDDDDDDDDDDGEMDEEDEVDEEDDVLWQGREPARHVLDKRRIRLTDRHDDTREELVVTERDRLEQPSKSRHRGRSRGRDGRLAEEIVVRSEEREPRRRRHKAEIASQDELVIRDNHPLDQEVMHYRHVDHGYETRRPPRGSSTQSEPLGTEMLHRFGDRASQDEHRPHARPRQTVQLVDRGQIGRRYHGVKDPRDSLWTEITKDLVLREAIERAGYEYEETEHFYYVFSFLNYDDMDALVDLSDKIRRARRERIRQIHRDGLHRLPGRPWP